MKILVAGYGQYEWFAPAWVKGLQQLGHNVAFFDWSPLFPGGVLGKIEYKLMWGPAVLRTNSKLRQLARSIHPDILLIHCGFPIYPETVAQLAQSCWITGFHHDDPFGAFGRKAYFRLFRRAIPFYQSHHVIREENLSDYRRLGVRNVKILMTYYVPWLHHPYSSTGLDDFRSKPQVVFIGHPEPDQRIQHVTDMVEADIPLSLFGSPEWNRYLPLAIQRRCGSQIKPLLGDAYARTISAAKICIAFYSGANRDRYSYRVFEIPACRGFLLAKRTDVMQGLYDEGKEAEYFSSSEELIDKIRFYLRHEEARAQIAQKGYERCLRSGYDVVSRMKQWLVDIEGFREG